MVLGADCGGALLTPRLCFGITTDLAGSVGSTGTGVGAGSAGVGMT